MKGTRTFIMASMVSLVAVSGALAQGAGPVIGVSWADFRLDRWKRDQDAIKDVITKAGGSYIWTDAYSSPQAQITDIKKLISEGANALIIIAQAADTILPVVEEAGKRGIPVIGYDRLIETPSAFYVSFDNKDIGRLQARAVFDVMPKGNYVFIKGAQTDPNADLLFAGQMEVLSGAIARGDVKNVGDAYSENWLAASAQRNMEQFLASNKDQIDAVVASNDVTAGGAIAALASRHLVVPVSGQDADAMALNRIALGTQTVSVWKDAGELGKRAAEIAILLARGKTIAEIPGTTVFAEGPRKTKMKALLLKSVPITRDNLNLVIDSQWEAKEVVCRNVPKATVKACD
jgi:D-xylose transport system substrate-binding protein